MRLFSQSGATYFCLARAATVIEEEVGLIVARHIGKSVSEGSAGYEEYRQNLVREAERCYFFGLSMFRRAHTLMLAASAPWAHVTLYYANWFAAQATLRMFGGWVGAKRGVEVIRDLPGRQSVRVFNHNIGGGSHRSFWSLYYDSIRPLKALVDVSLFVALDPVSNNPHWQTDTRNRVNYRVIDAEIARSAFAQYFDPSAFPGCLAGDLATQYEVTRSALAVAAGFLRDLSVTTDCFAGRAATLMDDVWLPPSPDLVVSSDAATLIV